MFELTADALALRNRVKHFVETELRPLEVEAEMNEGRIDPALSARHAQMAIDLGLSRMDAPKEYGGLALPALTQVAASEMIGRVTNALGWCYNEAQGWMFEGCSEDQIQRYILPLMRGEVSLCYAITEEDAGSDPATMKATAVRDGDDYVVNGVKWHVTSHNHATHIIVQAVVPSGDHCLFFCPVDAAGISTVRSPLYTHNYDHHHPILEFKDVRIPARDRIGEEGDGMSFTHAWFRHERLTIAARCCGAMERLIEDTTDFAKSRIISGQPISDFQMIQAMLADCVTDLQASRMITYEAAAAHDRGDDMKALHARCSIAKLFASEAAGRVADRCVQIFGGRGYMRENVAERFFRELRVDRIWEGTSEIQRLVIARSLIKRGLHGTIG